jgi:hypothetical protein
VPVSKCIKNVVFVDSIAENNKKWLNLLENIFYDFFIRTLFLFLLPRDRIIWHLYDGSVPEKPVMPSSPKNFPNGKSSSFFLLFHFSCCEIYSEKYSPFWRLFCEEHFCKRNAKKNFKAFFHFSVLDTFLHKREFENIFLKD